VKRLALIVFVLLVRTAEADQLGDEIAAIKIKLPAGRQLSSNDLRQVLQLSHRAGLAEVAEIRPALSQSADEGLSLTAKEIVVGRRISQRELTIWHAQWRPDPTRPHVLGTTNALGPFLLSDAPIYKREWATFKFNGKETRLECSSKTDLEQADKVFAALAAERVDYKSDTVRSKARLGSPQSIGILGGKVYIGFPIQSGCGDGIQGTLKGDRLIIEDAYTICS
jgi:hypothetical protein